MQQDSRHTTAAGLAALLHQEYPQQQVGVMIVDHGSRRAESNAMLDVVVEKFRVATGLPRVEPAHMELAEPSIAAAMARLVAAGAEVVIVFPFFLLPGRHWTQDIPRLVSEAALAFSGVRHVVTAPLGPHDLLMEVMATRIATCATHQTDPTSTCEVCEGAANCQRDREGERE